jgi:hypothetical protein
MRRSATVVGWWRRMTTMMTMVGLVTMLGSVNEVVRWILMVVASCMEMIGVGSKGISLPSLALLLQRLGLHLIGKQLEDR